MEKANLILTAIIGFATLIGFVFVIYRSYSEPNKKQDEEIAVGNATCELRHHNIDKNVQEIKESISLIKENHLKHIEERMNGLECQQIKIFTILEERLPPSNR